ncbi:PRC-barrel domain-containing protein [Streptomyces minutiscleroticus]|uniref:Photosystem reaction center subunit H n=1 Tax=Streptomyces minutiscleroticus TaxID=68238 RepID=A0A918KVZ0_9ACTN|nr:PRC-barrel domain-containing protein [Streptomyces minutiscleroticus]GGX75735.1 photosystem reaction center subunit H [Streptomyces minutiscleroticus]
MSGLTAARDLAKRPVVTLDGEAVAQIKDTVFDGPAGRIVGFTLSGRGLLAGPLRQSLPWEAVHSLGGHAVMIRGREALAEPAAVVARKEAAGGHVLGARVLTDAGAEIGTVLDIVVEGGTSGRVVGFRIAASESLVPGSRRRRRKVYVPRGETLAVSGTALVVPAGVTHFVADDLPSFVGQIDAFRARAGREGAGPAPGARAVPVEADAPKEGPTP